MEAGQCRTNTLERDESETGQLASNKSNITGVLHYGTQNKIGDDESPELK